MTAGTLSINRYCTSCPASELRRAAAEHISVQASPICNRICNHICNHICKYISVQAERISLHGALCVGCPRRTPRTELSAARRHEFVIQTRARDHYFACLDEEESAMWVDYIHGAIGARRALAGSAHCELLYVGDRAGRAEEVAASTDGAACGAAASVTVDSSAQGQEEGSAAREGVQQTDGRGKPGARAVHDASPPKSPRSPRAPPVGAGVRGGHGGGSAGRGADAWVAVTSAMSLPLV